MESIYLSMDPHPESNRDCPLPSNGQLTTTPLTWLPATCSPTQFLFVPILHIPHLSIPHSHIPSRTLAHTISYLTHIISCFPPDLPRITNTCFPHFPPPMTTLLYLDPNSQAHSPPISIDVLLHLFLLLFRVVLSFYFSFCFTFYT